MGLIRNVSIEMRDYADAWETRVLGVFLSSQEEEVGKGQWEAEQMMLVSPILKQILFGGRDCDRKEKEKRGVVMKGSRVSDVPANMTLRKNVASPTRTIA